VEDHFGLSAPAEIKPKPDTEQSEESDDEYEMDLMMIERNPHICLQDSFEAKFKLLYLNK